MALNFPAKIYQILENESADVVRWLPNGGAFRIVDHGRFEREIIPKYFRHNQISSVQRQLNLYGFKCVSRGEDKGAFFHPKFRRGDWEIVKKITRYAPMKKPDEIIDPTRSDDFVLPLSNSPVQVNGGAESVGTHNTATTVSTSTSTATSTASGPSAPHSMYHHHISAHAFQNYANTFHRPYDPFGYNEIPPFPVAPPLPVDNSMYATARRPPAWAWNGGPIPQHYANAYLMRQPVEQSASSASHQASKDTAKTTPVKASELTKVETATKVAETSTTVDVDMETNKSMKKTPSYMNIVNDVVLIDPDFDLDEEFDFLNDVVPAMKDAASPYLNEAVTMKATPRTSEIGVNTEISQASSTGFFIDF